MGSKRDLFPLVTYVTVPIFERKDRSVQCLFSDLQIVNFFVLLLWWRLRRCMQHRVHSQTVSNFSRFFSRYHTSLNATLKIYSVQEGDEGSYQCVAKNDEDSGQSVGYLWLGGNEQKIN